MMSLMSVAFSAFRRWLPVAAFSLATVFGFGVLGTQTALASPPRVPPVSAPCTTDSECVSSCNTTCPTAGTDYRWGGEWLCDASYTPVCAPVAGGGRACSYQCAPAPEGWVYRCEFSCSGDSQNRKGTRLCRNSGDTAPCDGDCSLTCGVGNCQVSSLRCALGQGPDAAPTAPASTPTGGSGGGTGGARGSGTGITNPIGVSTIQGLFSKIIRAGVGLAGSFALAVFVWGGVLWMTARGDTSQVKKAKSILTQALIGLLLIFFSYTIISAFLQIFTTTARLG